MSATETPNMIQHPPQHPPKNGATPVSDADLFDPDSIDGLPDSIDGLYVSEEQYWADYYQSREFTYEWNNGRLEQKPMTDYAQFLLYSWFFDLLKDFLHVNPIARMTGLELGFRMALARKKVVRIPDLGIVRNDNVVPLLDKDRSYKGIFDICIESLSDSQQKHIDRDVIQKKNEYAEAGVREYFILDERGKETQFYRLNANGIYLPIRPQNGVIRSTVLPGFQFRHADLYRLPKPPVMLDDVVYQAFTSPYVRAERIIAEEQRHRAEAEHERAEQERDRAEQERIRAEHERIRAEHERIRAEHERDRAEHELTRAEQERGRAEQEYGRAERYAKMLRELGVDPDA